MSEDTQNNTSQATATFTTPTSTSTTSEPVVAQPIVDFSSSIYRNPDYGNTSQKSFVVYNSKDSDKSK